MSPEILMTALPAFLELPPSDRPWLVEELIPGQGLAIVAGDPKSFKSLLVAQLGLVVASEDCQFLERNTAHGPVILVEEEGTRSRLQDRLERQASGLGARPPRLHVAVHQGVQLAKPEALRKKVEEIRPVLVILDPLVFMHEGNENLASDMAPLMRNLVRLANESGCTLVLVHHVPKPQADRPASRVGGRIRGSSVFGGATDANLIVSRAGLALHLDAELRDADNVAIDLRLDPETLLLHPSDGPARKVPHDELIRFVREEGTVTVVDVGGRFNVARNTARDALEELVEHELLRVEVGRRGRRSYSLVREP